MPKPIHPAKEETIKRLKSGDHPPVHQLAKEIGVSRQTIHNWANESGVGRPKSRTMVETHQKISEHLEKNPQSSMREVAEKLGISPETAYQQAKKAGIPTPRKRGTTVRQRTASEKRAVIEDVYRKGGSRKEAQEATGYKNISAISNSMSLRRKAGKDIPKIYGKKNNPSAEGISFYRDRRS